MTLTMQSVGVIAFGAVLLLVVVYTLVEWVRSRGQPAKEDKEEGGGGYPTGPGAPHGGDGGADSGGDAALS